MSKVAKAVVALGCVDDEEDDEVQVGMEVEEYLGRFIIE